MDFVILREAAMILLGGLLLALLPRIVVRRVAERFLSPERGMLLRRLAFWGVVLASTADALDHAGVDLSVFLGAAGILTVALGFASQTSASNFISGLFLVGERPFTVGNFVQIGSVQGEVIAVDWLSVKLRTPDNRFVRVPNEAVMKAEIQNFHRFDIRRIDLEFGLAADNDLDAAEACILACCAASPVVLDEPGSFVQFLAFSERGAELRVCAWAEREDFLESRKLLAFDLHRSLRRSGITLAYPHRVLVQPPTE